MNMKVLAGALLAATFGQLPQGAGGSNRAVAISVGHWVVMSTRQRWP